MLKKLTDGFIVLIFILLLPIIVPVSLIQAQREKRQMRKLADQFVCLECVEVIGVEALRLADERWSEIVKKIIDENDSGTRLRLVRSMDAICPHCGCVYLYHKADQTFVVRSEDQAWKKYEESMVSAKEL
ncbi:hypothetical protein [Gimesia fumaroli]|uniref:Uncharacterized protein n=1 Tax=Gimesia fumaroli TaxID=2527976 RepID=A0A518ICS0_9PLAN|nr:hypothetical protein [Gimesia fumaroli]QDV50906.1 hypothetical protein Enr17x_29510 [Gimesia fumaroli]